MDDFNVMHRAEDRMIGSSVHDSGIKDFSSYLVDSGKTILKYSGRKLPRQMVTLIVELIGLW